MNKNQKQKQLPSTEPLQSSDYWLLIFSHSIDRKNVYHNIIVHTLSFVLFIVLHQVYIRIKLRERYLRWPCIHANTACLKSVFDVGEENNPQATLITLFVCVSY